MGQDKWETWASVLHGDATEPEGAPLDAESEKDLKAGHRIFNAREKVGLVMKLKSPDEAWDEIKGNLYSSRARWMEFSKYAAIFLLSLLITGSAFWAIRPRQMWGDQFASISAPNGQITNITLFDGTNVWLNAGSTLTYKQSFNNDNREVILEGEALFTVTKNEKIPFIVHAGDAQVKVFGTQFNVKAYKNDVKIETVLIEGEVQFSSNQQSVMMNPGELVLFEKSSGNLVKNRVNTEEYTSWKGGKIYFNNETLHSLAQQLERWYEVKISFQDERIKSFRFSGVINKEKSLEYTLNIIQEINKIEFEFNQDYILVKEK